jgi:hypothetical protein
MVPTCRPDFNYSVIFCSRNIGFKLLTVPTYQQVTNSFGISSCNTPTDWSQTKKLLAKECKEEQKYFTTEKQSNVQNKMPHSPSHNNKNAEGWICSKFQSINYQIRTF